MIMKRLLPKSAGALLLALAFGGAAIALPINGNITFAGDISLGGPAGFNFGTATSVQSWDSTIVNNVDGDFATYISAGAPVTFQAPWTFNSGSVENFWNLGGFQFDLIASALEFQDATSLSVKGTGTTWGNGFDPTEGTWLFSTQSIAADGLFSFAASVGSASPGTSVPDGGTTLLLLGGGLIGLTLLSRRRGLGAT